MPISAWIISLDPEQENAKKLAADLLAQGFDVRFFPAVDGRSGLPSLNAGESISAWRSLVYRGAELTPSEVGCYLSHYRLIKQAYDEGQSQVLIFEDDVALEGDIYALIERIVDLPQHHHLVRLMALKIRKRKGLIDLGGTYQLTRPIRGALGTQGYVLNREGMRKVLAFGAKLTMGIDNLFDSFFLYGLKCYVVEPHAIYEIESPSFVKKQFVQPPLWARIGRHFYKLYRSVFRRIDYWINKAEYQGAEKPGGIIGRSSRLRD